MIQCLFVRLLMTRNDNQIFCFKNSNILIRSLKPDCLL